MTQKTPYVHIASGKTVSQRHKPAQAFRSGLHSIALCGRRVSFANTWHEEHKVTCPRCLSVALTATPRRNA